MLLLIKYSDEARSHKTMASNLSNGSESLGELRLKLSLNLSLYQPLIHPQQIKQIRTSTHHLGFAKRSVSLYRSRIRSMVSQLLRVLRTCMPKGTPPLFSAARVPHLHALIVCFAANRCSLRSPRSGEFYAILRCHFSIRVPIH